jgi:hypothetical protein
MKTFTLLTQLNLEQVIQLRGLTGATNGLPDIFKFCEDLLSSRGITPVYVNSHINHDTFSNSNFQEECKLKVEQYQRTTVVVQGKLVYQDEYDLAVARLKEVK